jgi:N-acetylglucosamine kinase-like BadF-type ATPase
VLFDPAPLVSLYAARGDAGAEDAVCAALEAISHRLCRLDHDHSLREIAAIPRLAHEIAALGDRIGLTTLARVARAVARCAETGDSAALGATLARLGRVADRSISEIWDVHDP